MSVPPVLFLSLLFISCLFPAEKTLIKIQDTPTNANMPEKASNEKMNEAADAGTASRGNGSSGNTCALPQNAAHLQALALSFLMNGHQQSASEVSQQAAGTKEQSNQHGSSSGKNHQVQARQSLSSVSANHSSKYKKKIPCSARGMPMEHDLNTAYFEVPDDIRHGASLVCSFPECRNGGVKFLWCSTCKEAVSKRTFRARHLHNETRSTVSASSSTPKVEGEDLRLAAWSMLLEERPKDIKSPEMTTWLLQVVAVSEPGFPEASSSSPGPPQSVPLSSMSRSDRNETMSSMTSSDAVLRKGLSSSSGGLTETSSNVESSPAVESGQSNGNGSAGKNGRHKSEDEDGS